MREIDIAIIGGGPCGSAACYGLQTVLGESSKVEIFERAKQLLPVGNVIGIGARNLKLACNALQEGLFDEFCGISFPRKSVKRFDQFGNFEKELTFGVTQQQQQQQQQYYLVPWYKIQQILMKKLLPNSVNLASEISSLVEVQDGVLLTFQNGEQVKAKLVLGADGNFSKTRMLLFDEKAPGYSGTCVWRIQCKGVYKNIQPENCNIYIGNGQLLFAQCTHTHLENSTDQEIYRTFVNGFAHWPENRLHELLHVRYQGPQNKNTDPQKLIDRFKKQFGDFPKDFIEWIREHIDTDLSLEHAIYARDPYAPWGKGRVSLMGDAAHVMPPVIGQGLSQAFEDALEIAHSISEFGITSKALREYEKRRIVRAIPIQKISQKNNYSFYTKGDISNDPFNIKNNERDVINKLLMEYDPKPIKRGVVTKAQIQPTTFKAKRLGIFYNQLPLFKRFVVY